jgi:hypothetical protein
MKKQTYDPELLNDILEETEIVKQMKLNCGAQRHHYSMFDVGRSMLDVHL